MATGKNSRNITEQDGSNTDQAVKIAWEDADPVFRNHMQARLFYREHQYLDRYGDETTGEKQHEERKKASQGSMAHGLEESPAESFGEALEETAASVSGSALSLAGSLPLPVTGTLYQLQQLEDFDFLMKHFYRRTYLYHSRPRSV